jgi:hypothetical protein
MKATEIIVEGKSHPVICVDVQPEYSGMHDGDENSQFVDIINFVNNQTGPVLFYVNAEDQGLSGDSVHDVQQYWNDTICPEDERFTYDDEQGDYVENENCPTINWSRFTIVDKGYGYLRDWMDRGVSDAAMVKAIRLMYQEKVHDSRQLFGGEDSDTYEEGMKQLLGHDYNIGLTGSISINWTSVSQLKKFNGAYLVGGGRNECLKEITLLMNAFNIKYKAVNSLIYG